MRAYRGVRAGLLLNLGLVCSAGAQSRPEYAPAIAMPQDRAVDSYVLYSQLLPGNVIEWGNVPRSQWLVEDTTQAEPLGLACDHDDLMNPHRSVRAPEPREAEFAQVLADFDAHCHVRYQLSAEAFHLALPLRLLNDMDRNRFVQEVAGFRPPANDVMRAPVTPREFQGAAGLHRFTGVYFNRAHSMAMTEIGMYCGSLCGQWSWVVLERTATGWRILPWQYVTTIS